LGSWAQTTRPGLTPKAVPMGEFTGSVGVNTDRDDPGPWARASLSGEVRIAATPAIPAATRQRPARAQRDPRACSRALRNAKTEPTALVSQITNPAANGNAALWHG